MLSLKLRMRLAQATALVLEVLMVLPFFVAHFPEVSVRPLAVWLLLLSLVDAYALLVSLLHVDRGDLCPCGLLRWMLWSRLIPNSIHKPFR